jgi:signal transduction histidine kinase
VGERVLSREQIVENFQEIKDEILRLWEDRVRREITPAKEKSQPILHDSLPEYLDNLADNISPSATHLDRKRTGEIGYKHGEDRANIDDYSLSQLVHEYRILRRTIFEVFDRRHKLTPEIRDIILDFNSEGIQKAVQRFAAVRTEELRRSNKELEHFAAIAAHDLKSPLGTISGYMELLDMDLAGKIPDDDYQYIKSTRRLVGSMALLVDRLLEYSSLGRERQPFSPVSMDDVVREAVESLRGLVEETQATVHYRKLPILIGERALLLQLFQNLISNAIKFREQSRQPLIAITVEDTRDFWKFRVDDNGKGFDTSGRENLFDLFTKGPSATGETGHGIGLATVRKIVDIHHGEVWAESKKGVGSTFYFTIPK